MRTANGSALVVRAKAPYIQRAAGVDNNSPELAESIRGKSSVYLVAPDPRKGQESAPLELYFERIFEMKLEAWHTEPDDWPKVRDLRTFMEWSTLKLCR